MTPLSEVKVLILGQDPYHNEHQAHGLSFPYCRIRKRFHHLYRTSIKNYRMTLAAISLTMVIWKMGKAGCIIIEHGSDRPCTSGELPSGQRMGAFYGCHYPGGQCPGSTSCLYAVGQTGTEQNSDAYQSEASDIKSTSSKPAFGIPWFLRMQTFLTGECILEEHGVAPIDWQIENL